MRVLEGELAYDLFAADADIGLPEMLAPDPTFTRGSDRKQCRVYFENRCTRHRPIAVIAGNRPIAPFGRAEFSIPAIQPAKRNMTLVVS